MSLKEREAQWRAWLGIDDVRPDDAPLMSIAKNVSSLGLLLLLLLPAPLLACARTHS